LLAPQAQAELYGYIDCQRRYTAMVAGSGKSSNFISGVNGNILYTTPLPKNGNTYQLIRRQYGVAMSVVSVGRLLAKLGLTCQRPLFRAYQQDPDAVDQWMKHEFPRIAARAKAEHASVFFADEAGIRSDYQDPLLPFTAVNTFFIIKSFLYKNPL
jgi:hypothetical protein